MKRTTFALLALVLVIGVAAAPFAEAGLFGKKKPKSDRTEKPDWMKKPRRFDGPVMSFHSGVLQQDGWTGWKLGETKLQFTRDCHIAVDGSEEGFLEAGREAIVMGPKVGDTIVAWTVRVQKPSFTMGRNYSDEKQLEPSETNPDCGEVIRSPM